MELKALPAVKGNYNLNDYDEAYRTFDWKDAEKNFSWYKTGKVNAAYEAIDRHAESSLKNKVAFYYKDPVREEKYTFREMKNETNKAGNVLKQHADVKKGDRVFVFMPRSPELYFVILGAVKLGAIVGPLFEAFMEGAVKDRLLNSQAKVVVTTPELLNRIPVNELPDLKSIVVVGEGVKEEGLILDYFSKVGEADTHLDIEWVDHEDGMLLHYTSGSTGDTVRGSPRPSGDASALPDGKVGS